MRSIRALVSVLALSLFCTQAFAQSRTEKKEAKIEESGKPKSIAGGVEVRIQQPYADTYEALVNWTKRSGYTIDKADKDVGQIITAMTVTGGVSQTGARIFLTASKESDTETTIKVAVSEQNRKKLLQTEPWGDPKLNEKESQALAERVKTALQLKPSGQSATTPTSSTNAPAQTRKPITNGDVIRLVKNGFADDQVLAVIAASDPKFDVSVDALIELKSAGVSQKLMETILLAGKVAPAAIPGAPLAALAALSASAAPLAQPYVEVLKDDIKSVIASRVPTLIQTKAKGDNITTLLADAELRNIAADAVASAAASAAIAGAARAAIPILGFGVAAISAVPGFRREPEITLVYALPNRQSASVVGSDRPKFEVYFGDVVGANPAEFAPAIVKVSPTENNWRLTGAQKTTAKQLQSKQRADFKFIEEVVASNSTSLGRGHIAMTPQQPLPPGEYGIVFRPVSKTWKMDMSNLVTRSGEAVLLLPVWDFTIRPSTEGK